MSPAIHAQSSPPAAPAFEVASVKRNVSDDTRSSWRTLEDGSIALVNRQLGLKLEPRTAPYEVFVIDSVEMPTPN